MLLQRQLFPNRHITLSYLIVNSLYDPGMPQSHTTDQPSVPLGGDKERQQKHDIQNTTNVKQQALSFPAG